MPLLGANLSIFKLIQCTTLKQCSSSDNQRFNKKKLTFENAAEAATMCKCEIHLKCDISSKNLLGLNLQVRNHQTGQFLEQILCAIYTRNYFCS